MNNTPAFPVHPDVNMDVDRKWCGMTLRDYFAAKAMQGIYAKGGFPTGIMIDTAKEAYEMADAMLKARDA